MAGDKRYGTEAMSENLSIADNTCHLAKTARANISKGGSCSGRTLKKKTIHNAKTESVIGAPR
jgi:hypothetical protein